MNPEFEITYEFRSRSIKNEVNQILDEHFVSLGSIDMFTSNISVEISRAYAQFVVDSFDEVGETRLNQSSDMFWVTARTVLQQMHEISLYEEPPTSVMTPYQVQVIVREVIMLLNWRLYGLPPKNYTSEEFERLLHGVQATQQLIQQLEEKTETESDWQELMNKYDQFIEEIHKRLLRLDTNQ